MNFASDARRGHQRPRVLVQPLGATSSAGPDAVRLMADLGVILDPWQEFVLDTALGVKDDGSWAAKTVDVLCARQNGKNVILEAVELYAAVILGLDVMHTAHEFPTARKAHRRIKALIRDNLALSEKLVQKYESPATGYSFEFEGGGFLEFIARTGSSGRGFTGHVLILDEAQHARDDHLEALVPALSATSMDSAPQIWYTGTAPDARGEVWQRRRKAGRGGGAASNAYFEFSAPPDLVDLDDRAAWAQANPGLNIRISEDFIEDTERSSMSGEGFARERLSISPELVEGESIIPAEDWKACASQTGIAGPCAFALDVAPSRSDASFCVAGRSNQGGWHVEIVDHRRGTEWLVARAKQLQDDHGGVLAIAAGAPASSLLVDLEAAGVKVLEVSTADHAKACGLFYDAVVQHDLHHLDQPELNVAVAGAAQKFYGDSWLWGRRQSQVDITPVVAATLALWAAAQLPDEVMAVPEVVLL